MKQYPHKQEKDAAEPGLASQNNYHEYGIAARNGWAIFVSGSLHALKPSIMQKIFSIPDMARWVANFKDHDDLPFITTSALIELDDLEKFVAQIKAQKADCVRIYFLRFGMNDTPTDKIFDKEGKLAEGCKWLNASPILTQGTIAMVPAINFSIDEKTLVFSADDIRTGNEVHALLPGVQGKGTGLNPPPGNGIAFDQPGQ